MIEFHFASARCVSRPRHRSTNATDCAQWL